MDNMLNNSIKTEMEEFKADPRFLIAERVAYKKAISEHAKLLENSLLLVYDPS